MKDLKLEFALLATKPTEMLEMKRQLHRDPDRAREEGDGDDLTQQPESLHEQIVLTLADAIPRAKRSTDEGDPDDPSADTAGPDRRGRRLLRRTLVCLAVIGIAMAGIWARLQEIHLAYELSALRRLEMRLGGERRELELLRGVPLESGHATRE